MTHPHVLVIEHQQDAGLGLFGEVLQNHGLRVHTVGPDRHLPVPDELDGYDALIVLGGSMGPTDDTVAPWLPTTRQLLRSAVQQELPTLGICLGAQLLATALGGSVAEMPNGPEIGLQGVCFSAAANSDPLFSDFADSTHSAVQWHWLEAAKLPESASVLASSGSCTNQAFRVGANAWGVQFHPEALAATAADWARSDSASLDELGMSGDALVAEVGESEAALRSSWGQVADRFAQLVVSRLPAGVAEGA